jgi:hypothetical protein
VKKTRSELGSQSIAMSTTYLCSVPELVTQAVSSTLGMVGRIRVRRWQHTRVVTMILLLGVKAAVVAGETRAGVGRERQLVVGPHNGAVGALSSLLIE